MAHGSKITPSTLLQEACQLFDEIGREVDQLAAQEQTASVPEQVRLAVRSKSWQLSAQQAANRLNRAVPRMDEREMPYARKASAMLSEIIGAQKPEMVMERYHQRRDEITTTLARLRQAA